MPPHGGKNVEPAAEGSHWLLSNCQKSASKLISWRLPESRPAMTPDFWYSPTRFSKKLVLPLHHVPAMRHVAAVLLSQSVTNGKHL